MRIHADPDPDPQPWLKIIFFNFCVDTGSGDHEEGGTEANHLTRRGQQLHGIGASPPTSGVGVLFVAFLIAVLRIRIQMIPIQIRYHNFANSPPDPNLTLKKIFYEVLKNLYK